MSSSKRRPSLDPVAKAPERTEDMLISEDFEKKAVLLLDKAARAYYCGGSDDEISLRENVAVFRRYLFIPRAMRNVSNVNTKIELKLRESVVNFDFPFGLAPCAMHKMANIGGENATVKATADFKIPMVLSTLSSTPMEEIAEAGGENACLWLQIYLYKNRDVTAKLIRRAEAAGFKGVVYTIDAPVFGRRLDEWRQRFYLPPGIVLPNFEGFVAAAEKHEESKVYENQLFAQVSPFLDEGFTWESLDWLKTVTKLPIIVKGILNGPDAELAVHHGADAVYISNHGGRQLDGGPSCLEALPAVAKAVRGRVPVIFDGGIRSGSDVFKALALGADLVLFTRSYMYALTVGGYEGIMRLFHIFKDELVRSMCLTGVDNASKVPPEILVHREQLYDMIADTDTAML